MQFVVIVCFFSKINITKNSYRNQHIYKGKRSADTQKISEFITARTIYHKIGLITYGCHKICCCRKRHQ